MKKNFRVLFQEPGTYGYLVAAILPGILSAVFLVTQTYYLSRIINNVFLAAQSLPQVWHLMLLLLALILARALLTWINGVLTNHVAGRIKRSLRERILRHLFTLGPAYLKGERSGELVSTTIEGVEALDPYVSQYLPQIVLSIVVPAMILVAVFSVDVPSGIILLVLAPLLPFLLALVGMMAGAETKRRWRALSLMSAHFLDVLQGLTTLKLFGRSEAEAEQVRVVSERFRRTTMSTLRIAFFSSFVLEEAATISTAVIAVEIGLRLLVGQMPFQPALFVLLLAPEFFQPLRQLGAKYHASANGSVATERIDEILATPLPSPRSGKPQRQRVSLDQSPNTDLIRFAHVDYTYDSQRPALHNISFHITTGQKVALVGPSGAGKSTIAHLLLRFIQAEGGEISVNGTPLDEIPIQEWRKQIAWVPQHPYLFHTTVADNIRLGCPQASLEAVIEAAKLACAREFIDSLPQGYETMIGERGSRLSGGEAQRISLARAFLKNTPLLILDEATSYLDSAYEVQILEAIARLMRGRTVLILAHRLSTVCDADQIVVLERGRVVEVGTHQELLRQSGLYRQLIMAHEKELL
jgi:ATP-binding cassette, subfamily C, bacterial CydD